MFIEPTITWVPSGFSGYIWLDTKIVLKKKKKMVENYSLVPTSVDKLAGPFISETSKGLMWLKYIS